jgi:hypothetical protein
MLDAVKIDRSRTVSVKRVKGESPEPTGRAKSESWPEPDLGVLRLHRRPAVVPCPLAVLASVARPDAAASQFAASRPASAAPSRPLGQWPAVACENQRRAISHRIAGLLSGSVPTSSAQ